MSNTYTELELLKSGNFYVHKTADDDREGYFKQMKQHITSGDIMRDIRSAPRCARYKIHYYHAPNTILENTVEIGPFYGSSLIQILEHYNLPINFDFKNAKFGDFETVYNNGVWYLKYKGEIDCFRFTSNWNGKTHIEENPGNDFWLKLENDQKTCFSFKDIIYQIHNYIKRYNIFDITVGYKYLNK